MADVMLDEGRDLLYAGRVHDALEALGEAGMRASGETDAVELAEVWSTTALAFLVLRDLERHREYCRRALIRAAEVEAVPDVFARHLALLAHAHAYLGQDRLAREYFLLAKAIGSAIASYGAGRDRSVRQVTDVNYRQALLQIVPPWLRAARKQGDDDARKALVAAVRAARFAGGSTLVGRLLLACVDTQEAYSATAGRWGQTDGSIPV